MMKSANNQSGFTLVELMIIVSIIAILSTIAYPSVKKLIKNIRAREAVSEITGNIKLTRAFAIKESTRNYLMTCDASGNRYSFGYDSDGDLVPDGFGAGPSRTVSLADHSNEISFGSNAPNGPPDSLANSGSIPGNGINLPGTPPNVRFNPDGSVSNVGGIFIRDQSGNNYCVGIDTISGTIILWRWEGGNNWKKIF